MYMKQLWRTLSKHWFTYILDLALCAICLRDYSREPNVFDYVCSWIFGICFIAAFLSDCSNYKDSSDNQRRK